MKRIDSMLQRAAVILIMLILALPGLSSAQVAGTDFAPGSYFTVEDSDNEPATPLEVYNTNPHVTPAQRVKVMTIPGFINGWGISPTTSPAYDVVRHRLYQAVRTELNFTSPSFVIWIDPVTSSPPQWDKVGALPSQCANLGISSQVTVDSSTGSLFCTGRTGDGSVINDIKFWLVKINSDNGDVMGPPIELGEPNVAVDPLHHKLYAIDPARNIIAIDTQSLSVTNTGAVLDTGALCSPSNSCLPFQLNITLYDSISHSLFGLRVTRHFLENFRIERRYQLVKLDLAMKKWQFLDIASGPDSIFSTELLVLDETHHRLYLSVERVPGAPFAFDISQSTPVSIPVVGHVPRSSAFVTQVILLDWTNGSSRIWKQWTDLANNKTELLYIPGTSQPVTSASQPFRDAILQHVRKIYGGGAADESSHIHIPILEYKGVRRSDEVAHHATYVRPSVITDSQGQAVSSDELGIAWDTVSQGQGCDFDRFNRRKSGEVAVFIDPTATLNIPKNTQAVGETVAHEVGHALGLRHVYNLFLDPNEVMDYESPPVGITEAFSKGNAPILEPPNSLQRDPLGFTTHNPMFHLRRYVLGEQVSDPYVSVLPIGDWDRGTRSKTCKKVTLTFVDFILGTKEFYNLSILGPGWLSIAPKSEGRQTLAYFDRVTAGAFPGSEVVVGAGAPLQIVASSVQGSDWDLYFVPVNSPSQLEIPGRALTSGTFAGKIMKYAPLTMTFSEVGTFSMNITEFQTDPPPGPPLPPNNDPVAVAGPDQTLPLPPGLQMTAVTLNGAGSRDLDGDTLSYYWSGPFGVSHGPQPTVFIPAGTHVVTLIVSDGKGGGSSDTVTINVVASVSIPGDLDGDGDIDKLDIAKVLEAKGKAASGPTDPRDIDKDGQITILDARRLATKCSRPNCAP